ncbi:hypothetical protein EVAR_30548_1 [Eumeta japonica]|uniref:Uncharacterized protein n=1 Tax=Eumeta variegata TaxID=151549 RepID=A0A4C1VPM5_EUMVA|nr:hypothetical protein EVAR_30548_1 [Eumeta japonica]
MFIYVYIYAQSLSTKYKSKRGNLLRNQIERHSLAESTSRNGNRQATSLVGPITVGEERLCEVETRKVVARNGRPLGSRTTCGKSHQPPLVAGVLGMNAVEI